MSYKHEGRGRDFQMSTEPRPENEPASREALLMELYALLTWDEDKVKRGIQIILDREPPQLEPCAKCNNTPSHYRNDYDVWILGCCKECVVLRQGDLSTKDLFTTWNATQEAIVRMLWAGREE